MTDVTVLFEILYTDYNWDLYSHNFYVYSNVQISLKFSPHYFWVTFFSVFQSRVSFIRLDNHQLFSDISVICVFKKLPVAKILKVRWRTSFLLSFFYSKIYNLWQKMLGTAAGLNLKNFVNSCAKFNSRPWEYLFIYIHIFQVISLWYKNKYYEAVGLNSYIMHLSVI